MLLNKNTTWQWNRFIGGWSLILYDKAISDRDCFMISCYHDMEEIDEVNNRRIPSSIVNEEYIYRPGKSVKWTIYFHYSAYSLQKTFDDYYDNLPKTEAELMVNVELFLKKISNLVVFL